MKILFAHNNFPGQYRRILSFIEPMKDVKSSVVTLETNQNKYPQKQRALFRPHREPTQGIHPSLVSTERAVLMGQAAYQALAKTKKKFGSPDIILSHSGWGASMFFKDIFPDAKLLNYYEWYYHCHGGDGEFLARQRYDANGELRIRMKNTPILHDLAAQDWGQSPTLFQHSRFPAIFRNNISVLHDGVDVDFFAPEAGTRLKVGDITLSAEDEVITYVARGMEEYRGFPQFMEAVHLLQKRRPKLQVVVLGADRIAYGNQRPDGKGLKEDMLKKYDFDMSRLHLMGLQPLPFFRDLMRISSAHIYLTAPFVLSWSMLEAMSTGALIIGSDTEPVRELIANNENGLLVDFWDARALVDMTERVLENQSEFEHLRMAARSRIVGRYAFADLVPKYWDMIQDVAAGRTPKLQP